MKKWKLRETKKVQNYRANEHVSRGLDLGLLGSKVHVLVANRGWPWAGYSNAVRCSEV